MFLPREARKTRRSGQTASECSYRGTASWETSERAVSVRTLHICLCITTYRAQQRPLQGGAVAVGVYLRIRVYSCTRCRRCTRRESRSGCILGSEESIAHYHGGVFLFLSSPWCLNHSTPTFFDKHGCVNENARNLHSFSVLNRAGIA